MPQTEIWLTPLISLPGVALLIMSTSARFGLIHTEFHHLMDHPEAGARITARHLVQRAKLFRNALVSLYFAVGFFALGSLSGGIVGNFMPDMLWVVGGLTLLGIAAVLYASLELIRESWICMQVIYDNDERITRREETAEQVRSL
jgi:hypothetical protein